MLSKFGIKTLWGGWNNEPYFGFSDEAYKQWKNSIVVGTRILLYEALKAQEGYPKGIQAIMAEVEIEKMFDEMVGFTPPTKEHPHLVGVKILRARGTVAPIQNAQICKIINSSRFPSGFSYRKLDEQTYNLLLKEWER